MAFTWGSNLAPDIIDAIRAAGDLHVAAMILNKKWGTELTYSALKNGCYKLGIDFTAIQEETREARAKSLIKQLTPAGPFSLEPCDCGGLTPPDPRGEVFHSAERCEVRPLSDADDDEDAEPLDAPIEPIRGHNQLRAVLDDVNFMPPLFGGEKRRIKGPPPKPLIEGVTSCPKCAFGSRLPNGYCTLCGVTTEEPRFESLEDLADARGSEAAQPEPQYPLPWQSYEITSGPSERSPLIAAPTEVQRGIIIPDTHVPLHSQKAYACALAIAKEWKPHFGVIIGDYMEMLALSRHPKNKPDLTRLAEEYYAANVALDDMQDATPGCDWTYIQGNHEWRADRYMAEYGELDGMLNVPVSLAIKKSDAVHPRFETKLRGMRWVAVDEQPYLTAHSAYYHGHHYTNLHHASSHANAYTTSRCNGLPVFYGHMHTMQFFASANGSYAQCVGFLGDEKALAYTLGKPTPWRLGLILQEVAPDGTMNYTPVHITSEGRALFHGKLVG